MSTHLNRAQVRTDRNFPAVFLCNFLFYIEYFLSRCYYFINEMSKENENEYKSRILFITHKSIQRFFR